MEINDFKYNPTLRKLLVNYVIRMYEDEAIIDDDHLMMEYKLLLKENNLNSLFLEEYLNNYLRDDEHNG